MKRLVVVPFEWSAATSLLDDVARRATALFAVSVAVHEHPLSMLDCLDPSRQQFNSRLLLQRLAEFPDGDWVLGVTEIDLFLPIFTFVLGEAQLKGRAAVISSFRLREELYGLTRNDDLVRERLAKEASHELGHCHGLVHCRDSRCVMFSATTVEDVDLRGAGFCPICRQQLLELHEAIRQREG